MKVLFISRSTLFSVRGGDTIQMEMTASELKKLGVQVDFIADRTQIDYEQYDLIHFFNIIRPAALLPHIKRCKRPIVISPIFVDYSEYEKQATTGLRKMLANTISKNALEYIKTLARWAVNGERGIGWKYFFLGQRCSIIKILKSASAILPNSQSELNRLTSAFDIKKPYFIINHGIDTSIFSTPNLSRQRSGVLCVGRIEGLKNQLNLIRAMNGLKIPLTLIGKPSPNHLKYYLRCKMEAGDNVRFIDFMSQAELKGYYAQAKVHVLPSWFETCGLSSLEAVAMGCHIVITDKGDTREIFGNGAEYCNPESVESIRTAILKAYESTLDNKLGNKILSAFTWELAARKTLATYRELIK
jgi:glycosyltransferase involved in cell wall biosynthesis